MAQKKYIELLNDLEQKASLLDPFIEGLRHILEASGVEVSEWYTNGTLSKEFVGQNTIAFELTGKTTHLLRND